MSNQIRKLLPTDDRSGFRCGDPDLDRYFERYVGQNQFRHHLGVTYVSLDADRITGFVTVVAGEVQLTDLPPSLRRRLPVYRLPALRIARLAVHEGDQGHGLGVALLRFSFVLAIRMRDELGCVGVIVDAKPEAITFYEAYGFVATEPQSGELGDRPAPTPMFLPVEAIG